MNRPVAVVTGDSRGIGRGIVTELTKTHCVVATYNRDPAAADKVARETGTTFLACHLEDPVSCAGFGDEIEKQFGAIDLLVNSAGMGPRQRQDILEATPESFDELIAANLKGPYFMASVNRGDYCISKAGLGMAAKLFATRLAAHGIGVFEVPPGIIRTDMIATVAAAYEEKITNGLLPRRRMGLPSDVATVILAIADGCLDYCTGQVIHANGGFHLRTL